jgi:hypothetical protein
VGNGAKGRGTLIVTSGAVPSPLWRLAHPTALPTVAQAETIGDNPANI